MLCVKERLNVLWMICVVLDGEVVGRRSESGGRAMMSVVSEVVMCVSGRIWNRESFVRVWFQVVD